MMIDPVPIVFDIGSFESRVGWSGSPFPTLHFRSLVKKSSEMNLVGNDLDESVMWEQARSPFDGEIIQRFDLYERIMDYSFHHLEVQGNYVAHPLVMSEVLCCPCHVRRFTSELCFESYGVPSVLYSPDCALGYYKECPTLPDGLSVVSGFSTTRICPIINRQLATNYSKRVDLGGYHATDHLFRLLRAKQPHLASRLDIPLLMDIKHSKCYVALNYKEELEKYEPDLRRGGFYPGSCIPRYYRNPQHILKQQLSAPPTEDPVEQAKKKEEQRERGKMLAARLAELRASREGAKSAEAEPKKKAVKVDRPEKPLSAVEQEVNEIPDEKVSEALVEALADKQKLTSIIKERSLSQGRHSQKSQNRMKAIASAARGEDLEEDFGVRDEDWDVYLVMTRDHLTEEEELDQSLLLELDEKIELLEKRESLEDRTRRIASLYTLDIGVERIRVPEVIFQPSLAGSQALVSIVELLQQVLSKLDKDTQTRLCKNIVLSGGT